MFRDLAVLLWYSFGTVIVLTQEILAVYPTYFPPTALTASAASRACNALALFQTIASHPETRIPFVRAQMPQYCYTFLDCTNNGIAFECLRRTSLGVLGALVKVATFIIQKILLHDAGLAFICATVDRFFNVTNVLSTMVAALIDEPSTKILKLVIRCYLRLTYHHRAILALRINFPEALKDGTFNNCIREDPEAVQWLQQLLDRLRDGSVEVTYVRGADHPADGSAGGGAPPPAPGAAV